MTAIYRIRVFSFCDFIKIMHTLTIINAMFCLLPLFGIEAELSVFILGADMHRDIVLYRSV